MSARRDRLRRRRQRGGASKPAFLVLGVLFTLLALGGLGAVAWVVGVAQSAPDLRELKPQDPGTTSVVYASDGTRLGFIESSVLRRPIKAREIPDNMKNATIAIEDRRFYDHTGVDFEGVVRAGVKNITSGKTVEGGSTLTMQLVRALYRDKERTFERKIREAKLAEELENAHPGKEGKEWILTKYINSVPYGTEGGVTAVGVQAAARTYFDKPAGKLKLHEAALLAGLPQAPSAYSPFRSPEKALARRNDVLDSMAEQGMIKPETAERTKAMELGVKPSKYYTERREGFFFDYVKQELIDRYGVEKVRQGGLSIKTTIDLKLQQAARKAIAGRLNFADAPSSAIVSIDPRNGYIRAMATSAQYTDRKFNLAAQGKRQPGSTFKIMVLMAAVAKGIDPKSTSYTSKPLKLNDPIYGPIEVKTYSNSYIGGANLVKATLSSDNSIYMQLDLDVGPENVTQAARDMGIKSKLNSFPAEGLGGLEYGVSPLEMANAYATLASGGWRNKPKAITKVTFPDGEVDDLSKPRRHKAFTDGEVYEITKILEANITGGTGTKANIGCPAGGKTGTTDNHRDAWFVGYTPRLATSTWVGYPDRQIEMTSTYFGGPVAGGTFPAEIWGDYMRVAKRDFCGDFPQPKTPFAGSSFSGKYQKQGGTGDDKYDTRDGTADAQDFETGAGTGTGTDNGGAGFNDDAYETPPQPAPQTEEPPATPTPAPDPAPTGGAGE
ncbi:transglycosylase domain-containing protein [Svornostia abyssi]|uniref:Transglycosylase domain-containing protein n=1 Tax=Svornostia abyssi TaxID=2898438 RepID=A0ABY5PJ07_9ACTN|nr:transglycosylase domain-containing protein [Parviterribacteraceae bacterium J379]